MSVAVHDCPPRAEDFGSTASVAVLDLGLRTVAARRGATSGRSVRKLAQFDDRQAKVSETRHDAQDVTVVPDGAEEHSAARGR